MRIFTFKNFRILVLLIILATVALYVKDQKLVTQGWYKTLDIVVYPINPTNSPVVQRYIDPAPPESQSNVLGIILWSLKLRLWMWQNAPDEINDKHLIRMFVLYHDPSTMPRLKHSVGLQKGLVGIVNAYGVKSQSVQNNIVITHEFFHTVGASDKYDKFGRPVVPDGLGNPYQSPRYPQKLTEIMAGRRALSQSEAKMPNSFKKIVVGEKTAAEIGWLNDI